MSSVSAMRSTELVPEKKRDLIVPVMTSAVTKTTEEGT